MDPSPPDHLSSGRSPQLGELVDKARDAIEKGGFSEEFAGMYAEGGILYVLSTSKGKRYDELRRRMEGLTGGREIVVRMVRFSLSELETAQRRIVELGDEMVRAGAELSGVEIDERSNVVIVTVGADANAAEMVVRLHVPDAIALVRSGPKARFESG